MHLRDAGVAQPVERHLAKVEVASSSLVTRSRITHPFWMGFIMPMEDRSMRTAQNVLAQVIATLLTPVLLVGTVCRKHSED